GGRKPLCLDQTVQRGSADREDVQRLIDAVGGFHEAVLMRVHGNHRVVYSDSSIYMHDQRGSTNSISVFKRNLNLKSETDGESRLAPVSDNSAGTRLIGQYGAAARPRRASCRMRL